MKKKTNKQTNAFRQKCISVLSFKCSTWIHGRYAPPGTDEGRASPTVTAIRVNMNETWHSNVMLLIASLVISIETSNYYPKGVEKCCL